ncbi:MAG: right-handed parallel beta-helix repeat-containing protein [Myxococcota bacterium]
MNPCRTPILALVAFLGAACGDSVVDQQLDTPSSQVPMAVELVDGGTGVELLGGLSLDFSSTRLSQLELRIAAEETVSRVEVTMGSARLTDRAAPFVFTREDGLVFVPGVNQMLLAGFDDSDRLIQATTLTFFIVVDDRTDDPPPQDPPPGPTDDQLVATRVELRELGSGTLIRVLEDGDTIERSSTPLMFEIVTEGDVESVTIDRDGQRVHVENGAPWQDRVSSYPAGFSVLRFTPWAEDAGAGARGTAIELTILITDQIAPPIFNPDNPASANADITLSDDFARSQYRPGLSGALVFDAYDASWTIDNCGWSNTTIVGDGRNAYPVLLESRLGGSEWYGGNWTSVIPQSIDWGFVYGCDGRYSGNSAAILFRGDATATNLRIDGPWDGVRFTSNNGTLKDSWISNCRDDGIEADSGANLLVENVLFDNCFVGISSTPKDNMTSSRTIRLDGVLMSLGNYQYRGNQQPGTFLKYTEDSPRTEIHNSVFAFDTDSSINNNRMAHGWEKTESCSNNLLLWTSDAPFPSEFPAPPSCFQVLEGDEARSVWEARRADFTSRW